MSHIYEEKRSGVDPSSDLVTPLQKQDGNLDLDSILASAQPSLALSESVLANDTSGTNPLDGRMGTSAPPTSFMSRFRGSLGSKNTSQTNRMDTNSDRYSMPTSDLPRMSTWTGGIDLDQPYGNPSGPSSGSEKFPRMSSWTGGPPSRASLSTTVSSILPTFPSIPINITTTKNVWQVPEIHHQISRSSDGSVSEIVSLLKEEEFDHSGPSTGLTDESNDRANKMQYKNNNKHHESHREENWHELFYDLIFVAAAIQIGTILKAQISTENIIQTSILFLILRSTWDNLMLYQNRFDTPDLLHYIFYLIHAMTAFVMTINLSLGSNHELSWNAQEHVSAFSFAACISRFTLAFMYVHVIRYTQSFSQGFRNYLLLITLSQFCSGFIFLLVSCLTKSLSYKRSYELLWVLAFFIEKTFVTGLTIIMQKINNKSPRMSQVRQFI